MLRKPFLAFFAIVLLLVTGAVLFIQSAAFARMAKKFVASALPNDSGIESDFSDLGVKFFPPGLSVRKPRVKLLEKNLADLPGGSTLEADELHLTFQPIQMLSGTIRVNEIRVVSGRLNLILNERDENRKSQPKLLPGSGNLNGRSKPRSMRPEIHWDELFQIRAEAVAAENTQIRIVWPSSGGSLQLSAKELRLSQWSGEGGLGYELQTSLEGIEFVPPKSMGGLEFFSRLGKLDRLETDARVNVAGVQVGRVSARAAGLDLTASGAIKGDVMTSKSLGMDLALEAEGDLENLLRVFVPEAERSKSKALTQTKGRIAFNGKFKGNPADFMSTARFEGRVQLQDAKYGAWGADSAKVEGVWVASPKGGELTLNKAVIEAKESARVIPNQPGWGGRVEIGPAKVSLENASAVTIPLKLDRAHLHWLAANAIDAVYGLNFRLTGAVATTLQLKPHWSISAKLDALKVQDFQLDNQKFKQRKPLSRILSIPEIKVDGGVLADGQAIKPQGLSLALSKTKFAVTGKLDFKNGFDLNAQGPLVLEEVGMIAESPIGGSGQLNAKVHGPASNVMVDFETELTQAHYLGLQFGELRGTIVYDDAPSHLIFRNMQARKRRSSYSVDGMIDLSDASSIDLKVGIPKADVQDFMQIFEVLTKDISWFPTSLSGPMSGSGSVTGGLDFKKMVIAASLKGNDWEFHGERFKQVELGGGYDQGRYHISELKALKRGGQIQAKVSSSGSIDWELSTQDLQLSDFDVFARLDVPIRGKVSVQSRGSGIDNEIKSSTEIVVSDATVRGAPIPGSQLSVKTASGVAKVSGNAMGGQGLLDLSYDFNPKSTSTLKLALSRLDFSPILLLLNPKSGQDRSLTGLITGNLDLAFNSGEIEKATGSAELTEYRLARAGTSFRLAQPVQTVISSGSFDVRELAFRGDQGTILIGLLSRRSELEGQISGNLDLSLLEFISPAIPRARGIAELDIAVGGTIKAPQIFGRSTLKSGSILLESLESPFENLGGSIQIKQNVATIQGIEADLAGGRVTADGRVEFFADRYPQVFIKGRVNGSKIKVYPFQYAKLRGALKVSGDKLPYLMEGAIQIESAVSREKMLTGRQGESLRSMKYTPPPRSRSEGDFPLFRLNIDATAEEGIFVQNDLFDAELKGKVTVVNTIDAPRLLGSAEVIQGKILFKDHAFQIQSATINFDSPSVLDPQFNLVSSTEVNNTKIQLFASGRQNSLKIDLASNPVMPETEILSLLALGLTTADTRRIRAEDRAIYERGEAASLLLHSLDFNREVQNKTGIQIQLDESFNNQVGTSAFRRPEDGAAGAAPKIVVKRRIGQRLDLSYGSTVGIGTNNQREVNAELHLTPGFSLLGVWDNFETLDTESRNRNSYGLDIKLQKRFK
jgi:hypothetical protein